MAIRPLLGQNVSGSQLALPITLGRTDPLGPRVYNDIADFTSVTQVIKSYALLDLGMTYPQCMYIDNTLNLNFVTFAVNGVNVSCPAQETLFTPLIVTGNNVNIVGYSAGGCVVKFSILNMLVPAYQSLPSFAQGSSGVLPNSNVAITNVPLPVTIQGDTTPVAVTGTFWQATQPISGSVVATAPTLQSQNSALNVTGNALLIAGPGRLFAYNALVAGSAVGYFYDAASVAGAASANILCAIPTPVGSQTFPNGIPFTNGLVIKPGTSQQVSVFY